MFTEIKRAKLCHFAMLLKKPRTTSMDAKQFMKQVVGDQEEVNWTDKTARSRGKISPYHTDNQSKGCKKCNYCGAKPSHPRKKCCAVLFKYVLPRNI